MALALGDTTIGPPSSIGLFCNVTRQAAGMAADDGVWELHYGLHLGAWQRFAARRHSSGTK